MKRGFYIIGGSMKDNLAVLVESRFSVENPAEFTHGDFRVRIGTFTPLDDELESGGSPTLAKAFETVSKFLQEQNKCTDVEEGL